jgi:hypothetical protein
MTTQEAINWAGGTQELLAGKLGCAQSTVSGWGEYPVPFRQLQIQQLSGGKLRAEPGLLSPKKKAA